MNSAFQVFVTDAGVADLRAAHLKMTAQGHGDEVLKAVSLLEERLGTDPIAAGQHRADLPEFGVQVLVGFVSPLILHYAVDEPRKRVYVHHIGIGA